MGKKIKVLLLISLFFISLFFLLEKKSFKAQASDEDKVKGWTWSESFGWFSLNCTNQEPCSAPYGVDLDSLGNILGWAWSENLGWICWGASCAGTTPYGESPWASLNKSNRQVSGWAKAIVLGNNGWIRLRGENVSPPSSYALCADCSGNTCNICYNHKYGARGQGYICSNCNSCSGNPSLCNSCGSCALYGTAVNSQTGQFEGWGWNSFQSGTEKNGIGWVEFNPEFGGVITLAPWLETKYGDIYSGGEVKNINPFSSLLGKYGATYLIQANNNIVNFQSQGPQKQTGTVSDDWEKKNSGQINFPQNINKYTNVLGKIDWDGLLTLTEGNKNKYGQEVVNNCANLINGGGFNLSGKIYYCGNSADLVLNNPLVFNNGAGNQDASGLILVDGNLEIKNSIVYQNAPLSYNFKNLASVGWVIKGDVLVSPSVEEIVGAFIVLGNGLSCSLPQDGCGEIKTGTTADAELDEFLTVKGLMMARRFNFQRLKESASRGSEQIIYDGRVIANTPPGLRDFTRALPLWRQTSP